VDRREGARLEQIFWRRSKIPEIGGSVDYFKREYLLTPDEAFMASNFDSFISADPSNTRSQSQGH
jgi:hypothetical protein